MGLPWVRLDTQFPHNPKVLALAEDKRWRALALYPFALAYSGAHGTDGFIQRNALPILHSTTREAEQLVEVGLWHPDGGGFQIPDYTEFQPSNDEAEERRQKMRALANLRWHGDATEDASA
jgi:hypothetical protein